MEEINDSYQYKDQWIAVDINTVNPKLFLKKRRSLYKAEKWLYNL